MFGLQYHPEVMHTEGGIDTLRHFLLDIAAVKADWTMAEVLETQLRLIEQAVSIAKWIAGVCTWKYTNMPTCATELPMAFVTVSDVSWLQPYKQHA